MNDKKAAVYSPLEEKLNIISHGIGLFLSLIAVFVLATHENIRENIGHIIIFSTFGIGLIALYSASTIYHSSRDPDFRSKMRVVDHAAIYILIAGTYTPLTLITLNSKLGWIIFSLTWAMAAIGVVIKIFFTGKYDIVSTLMYILMGWMIVIAFDEVVANLASDGLFWLITGGVAYTVGAILYSIKKIKFNHALFHAFVLAGSVCHFMLVYYYILATLPEKTI